MRGKGFGGAGYGRQRWGATEGNETTDDEESQRYCELIAWSDAIRLDHQKSHGVDWRQRDPHWG
jgi:hypothetical protein